MGPERSLSLGGLPDDDKGRAAHWALEMSRVEALFQAQLDMAMETIRALEETANSKTNEMLQNTAQDFQAAADVQKEASDRALEAAAMMFANVVGFGNAISGLEIAMSKFGETLNGIDKNALEGEVNM